MEPFEVSWFAADYNGVIVNDAPKGHQVFSVICREHNIEPPSVNEFRKYYSNGTFAANLQARNVPGTHEELTEKVNACWATLPSSKLMKGAWEALSDLRELEISCALVSRLNAQYAMQSLRKRELEQFFGLHIYVGLPEKVSTLRALSFQCGPERLLFVTDTALDIQEAKAAGCIVGAFTQGYGLVSDLKAMKPHFLFGEWSELFGKVSFKKP